MKRKEMLFIIGALLICSIFLLTGYIVHNKKESGTKPNISLNKNNNFDALPYISATEQGVKLLWRTNSSYIDKNYSAAGLTTEDWNNISSVPEQNKELNEEMLKSLFEQDGSYLDSEE